MKSEKEIREAMVGVLKAQIEAVETDNEFQYIYNVPITVDNLISVVPSS